jgi:hypothetical protein
VVKGVLYVEVPFAITQSLEGMLILTSHAETEARALGRTIGPPTVGTSDTSDDLRVVVWEINPAS